LPINIAKNDKDKNVRKAAVQRISDYHQKVLISIAKNDEDEYVRTEAVRKITDVQILVEIKYNDIDDDVRWAADMRLEYLGSY